MTPDDRSIPPYNGAELESNFYCRGRNTKRAKYCAARAGYGTDHVGLGRCKHHGGASPITHGLRSRCLDVDLHRIGPLIAKHQADPEPLNLLPEIATLRALLEDFLLRWEPNRDALLAWHHSFSDEYRDELRRAHAAWDPAAGPFVPPEPMPTRPREVLDISSARQIIAEITKAVERFERIRMMNAVPAAELARVMEAMGVVVRTHITDPTVAQRIADGWSALPVRLTLVH